MAMTKIELAAKSQIERILKKQGYPTYAKLFDMFDLNLTKDPNVIGYMVPGKAKIVLNIGLDKEQVSTIVRHEILHEYLNHGPRGKAFEKQKYKDWYGKEGSVGNHDLANQAADWEISNRGYTDADKDVVRNIRLGDRVLQGLVTELDNPGKGWEKLTFEEMYGKLLDQYKNDLNNIKNEFSGMPQIGDTGDSEIQDAEEIERQANAISDDAGEMIDQAKQDAEDAKAEDDKEGEKQAKDKQDKAEAGKKIADNVADDAKDLKKQEDELKNSQDDGEVFKDKKQIEKERKIEERRKKLQDALKDADALVKLEKETQVIREKEKIAKAARDLERYNAKPINAFSVSLNNFIAKELAYNRGGTWKKFNKNYISQGIIKKGITSRSRGNVPLINVYFDRSGSFSNYPDKTRDAENAISTLNKYVKQGKLLINLYYASTDVFQDREEAESMGGGMDSDPVIDHIKATKPDNVIILTDSDSNSGYETAEVPGGVWFLFYESDAPDFVKRLRGRKLTRAFVL